MPNQVKLFNTRIPSIVVHLPNIVLSALTPYITKQFITTITNVDSEPNATRRPCARFDATSSSAITPPTTRHCLHTEGYSQLTTRHPALHNPRNS
jgi:hypothetical protein